MDYKTYYEEMEAEDNRPSRKPKYTTDHNKAHMPGIDGLNWLRVWIGDLLTVLSFFACLLAGGATFLDTLLDRQFSLSLPWFTTVVGAMIFLGCDAMFMESALKAKESFDEKKFAQMFGWIALFVPLAIVVVQTSWAWLIQTGDNIATSAALAQLGVSPFAYYGERAFLLAIVGVTSALAAKRVIFRLAEWAVVKVNQSTVMAPRQTARPQSNTTRRGRPPKNVKNARRTKTGTKIGVAA